MNYKDRPLRFNSISARLTLLVLVTGVIAFIALAAWTLEIQTTEEQNQAQNELATLSFKSRSTLERIFRYQFFELVDEVIQELEVHRLVSRALLFDDELKIVYSTQSSEVNQPLHTVYDWVNVDNTSEERNLTSIVYNEGYNEFVSLIPVVAGVEDDIQVQKYTLLITFKHNSDIWGVVYEKRNMLLSQLTLVIILGVFLWRYLRFRLSAPLRLLRDNIERLRSSGVILSVPLASDDELGQIARSLESVSQQQADNLAQLNNLSTAIEQSNDAIVITSVKGTIDYVNRAYCRLSGYKKSELLGQNPRLLKSGEVGKDTYEQLWHHLSQEKTWRGELVNKRKDGSSYILWSTITPVLNEDGVVTHYIGVQSDITERRADQERLRFLAYHDSLTGLPNRAKLVEDIECRLEDTQFESADALFLLGVDELKRVNDARGFAFGSELIRQVSVRLTELIAGQPFTLAHLGGDVFALFYQPPPSTKINRSAATAFAQKLLLTFETPFVIDDETIQISVSAGCVMIADSSVYKNYSQAAEQIVRLAETAMHHAKIKGGNHAQLYHESLSELIENSFDIENQLRQAIAQNELQLFIQSQFNRQQQVVSAEALVRWSNPERGPISPADFIPVAEQSDLIISLDRWVLEQVLRLLTQLVEANTAIPISVNISGRHFRKPYFADWLITQLNHHDIAPSLLTLEVTEGVFLDDMELVVEKMRILRDMGIGLSLDDFGTGYSSLTYLRRLPVNEIKIDQSFVMAIGQQSADDGIIEAVMAVAHHMQLTVVAEGVETQEQAAFLFNTNANTLIQGFGFARPAPANEWFESITTHSKVE